MLIEVAIPRETNIDAVWLEEVGRHSLHARVLAVAAGNVSGLMEYGDLPCLARGGQVALDEVVLRAAGRVG